MRQWSRYRLIPRTPWCKLVASGVSWAWAPLPTRWRSCARLTYEGELIQPNHSPAAQRLYAGGVDDRHDHAGDTVRHRDHVQSLRAFDGAAPANMAQRQ